MTHDLSLLNQTPTLPLATGASYMDSAGLLDQNMQTGSGVQSPFVSNNSNSSSIGVGSPASTGGESIFSSDSRQLFSFAGTPETGNVAVNTSSTAPLELTASVAQELKPSSFIDCDPTDTNAHAVIAQPTPSIDDTSLPSLHDVQRWARRGSSRALRQGASTTEARVPDSNVQELLSEFAALNTTTTRAQREIMGIADTAAMYSQYFRQEAAGNHTRESWMRLIETLEQRMREISDIASRQVLAQARNSRNNLKARGAFKDHLTELETELGSSEEALAAFFRTEYDLSRPLAGQL